MYEIVFYFVQANCNQLFIQEAAWMKTFLIHFKCSVFPVLTATHYIEQTCRCVPDRAREHKDALTKPSRFLYMAKHHKNSRHNIDQLSVQIIARDNITIKRLHKETLAVRLLKLEINDMQALVKLNAFSQAYNVNEPNLLNS